MKITKRKWGKEPPMFFYRDVESGKLFTQGDRRRERTDILFKEQYVSDVFERSLQSRLLKAHDKDGNKYRRNEITELAESLCKNINLSKSVDKIKSLSPEKAEKQCNETLSSYGKSFAAAGSTITLREALLNLIKGNDEQKAMAEAELEKIQKALLKEKAYRINRVRSSIKKNKIPLIKDGDSITANKDGDSTKAIKDGRADWLLKLLQPVKTIRSIQPGHKAELYPVLAEMERIISFESLSHEIHEQVSKCDGRSQSIAKAADEAVRKHLRNIWGKHPEHRLDMKYYFQAVQEYFRENFPIRTKQEGARKRQKLLEVGDALFRLLEPKHIANTVRRKLINQSTQMNILYGKLYDYCCKGDNSLPLNSETLQRIQILEAVKKQVMTAVLWSVSRLCYFYQYQDGDILSDSQTEKDFRKKFLVCKEKFTDEDVQACKEKLQDFFPLEEKQEECGDDAGQKCKDAGETSRDDREMCNKLLEECVSYVRSLRMKIFHYKNMSFTQALKKIADEAAKEKEDKSLLLQLYKRDRKNLNKAFAHRISSMNLPLYYRDDLLFRIFAKHGAKFSLYSANNQMTPSFRRIYERGKNLRLECERELMHACTRIVCDEKNSLDSECDLKWFKQLKNTTVTANADAIANACISAYTEADTKADTNVDAQRAVRNLLQLIYKHLFLPEVQKNDTLVTSKISKVLDRNKKLAVERNKPKGARDFGYSAIQELYHKGMTLTELLKELQQKISETEKKSRELAQDKADYAQRFLREVFAEAFNSFMQERYYEEYDEIMRPQKNAEEAKKWIGKRDSVNLNTSFAEDKIEGYLLVLYPVMRMLDGKEQSELQQQMLRFRTSILKWQSETDINEDIEMVEKIEELAELVRLIEPIPIYAEEAWRKRAEKEFEQLIEGKMLDYGTFYLHSDSSSPVLRRNMTRLLRSGVMNVYRLILSKRYQATKGDYEIYCKGQWVMDDSDGRQITFVEYAQRALQQLHSEYAASPSRFSEADHKSYGNISQCLEEYNQAVRNLTFETLYEVCSINMEILSRWVGFVQDWERDMYFLLLAWVKQGKLCQLKEGEVKDIFANGRVVGKLFGTLKDGNMDVFKSVYRLGDDKNIDFISVRNDIAHLDLLRSSNWTVGKNQDCSVVESYINRLRRLLSYDQKRMNAVTKTMQKIFEKHKIRVEFTIEEGGKLKLKCVRPEYIEHLKKSEEKIKIPSHGKTFLSNLEWMMNYTRHTEERYKSKRFY